MGLYQWGDASKSLSKRSQLFNHEVGRLPSTPESRSKAGQACGMELVTIAARSFAISSPNSIRPRWGGWEGSLSSVCPYAPEENPIDNIWKPNRCCGKCTNSAGLSTSPRNYWNCLLSTDCLQFLIGVPLMLSLISFRTTIGVATPPFVMSHMRSLTSFASNQGLESF